MNRRDFLRGGALGAAAAVATASPFVQRLLTKIASLWRGGVAPSQGVVASGALNKVWRKVQGDVQQGYDFVSPEYDSILLDEWEGDPGLYWSDGVQLDAEMYVFTKPYGIARDIPGTLRIERFNGAASVVEHDWRFAPRDPVRSSIDRHARKLERHMSAALRRHTAALERHVNEMYYGRSA